jgi:hypothetical protein
VLHRLHDAALDKIGAPGTQTVRACRPTEKSAQKIDASIGKISDNSRFFLALERGDGALDHRISMEGDRRSSPTAAARKRDTVVANSNCTGFGHLIWNTIR